MSRLQVVLVVTVAVLIVTVAFLLGAASDDSTTVNVRNCPEGGGSSYLDRALGC